MLFDRVCSVAIQSTLNDIYTANIADIDVEVEGEVRLKDIKVSEIKSSRGSVIDGTETVSTLKDLGLRYVVFTCEKVADESEVELVAGDKPNAFEVLMATAKSRFTGFTGCV